MDDETKTALQVLSDRVSVLETKLENLALDANAAVDPATVSGGFYAGLDQLAHRTLAEARAVMDEYYGTYLSKVRDELGLPPVLPAPEAAPTLAVGVDSLDAVPRAKA